MALLTNYKDDILDTSRNITRKYNMINNADGTVSLQDVTVYTQNGSSYGAGDINATNEAVNSITPTSYYQVLDAQATTLTFSGLTITDSTKLQLYCQNRLASPSEVSVTETSVTYTFDADENVRNFRLEVL